MLTVTNRTVGSYQQACWQLTTDLLTTVNSHFFSGKIELYCVENAIKHGLPANRPMCKNNV